MATVLAGARISEGRARYRGQNSVAAYLSVYPSQPHRPRAKW
jgi:hypothetical protein